MIVMKFGGAVLSNTEGFENMLRIVSAKKSNKILLVISAFSKSTRSLKAAAFYAESGSLDLALDSIQDLKSQYLDFANRLLSDDAGLTKLIVEYDKSFTQINDLLRGVAITKELTLRTLDAIMSFGEKLSLITAYNYLAANGMAIAFIDSVEIIKTDNNYGNAKPYLEICEQNIHSKVQAIFTDNDIVITQGFVASSIAGEITTMGIESSNLTAAIYAKYLCATEFVIFTDVEGVRSADPKVYDNTEIIPYLSYDQAYSAGVNGLKLIFPKMIDIIRSVEMTLCIKSAALPNGEYTIISSTPNSNDTSIRIDMPDLYLSESRFASKYEEESLQPYIANSKSEILTINANNEWWALSNSQRIIQLSPNNEVKPIPVQLTTFISANGNIISEYNQYRNQIDAEKILKVIIQESSIRFVYK